MTSQHPTPPVFVGVCRRALVRGDGVSQDFYEVGEILPLPFFPQNLQGVFLVLAYPLALVPSEHTVKLIIQNQEDREKRAWSNIGFQSVNTRRPTVRLQGLGMHYREVSQEDETSYEAATPLLIAEANAFKLIPVPCPPLLVTQPARIEVVAEIDGIAHVLGMLGCAFVAPPPISDQERLAIRSRPGALRGFDLMIQCKKCGDRISLYEMLVPGEPVPQELGNPLRMADAPDRWVCKCQTTDIPLIYMKQGSHELFRTGSIGPVAGQMRLSPLYERGAIATLLKQYEELIGSEPEEQRVQEFLEGNPIFWNFLAPKRIWHKPPVTTKNRTDFGILTRHRSLCLVEIEKPQTRLLRGDGGVHS